MLDGQLLDPDGYVWQYTKHQPKAAIQQNLAALQQELASWLTLALFGLREGVCAVRGWTAP